MSTNPLALFYNPAAMAFAKGSQLAVYGQLAVRHASWDRPGADSDTKDPPAAQGANTGLATLTNAFGGPSIGGTLKVGNLMLGAGFFAPFYGRAHWDQNPSFENLPATVSNGSGGTMVNPRTKFPGAAEGVQRWFSIDGATSILYFTAGAAYRFGPLSIGATGNFISSTVRSLSAHNPLGSIPDTSADPSGHAFLDAHSYNGSFAAGLMLEAVPNQLWIGASYQAQPGLGEQNLRGTLQITSVNNGNHTFDVDFRQSLPDIYRAGIKWRPKHTPLEFRVFGDRTRWSRFKGQCLLYHGNGGNPCTIGADGQDLTGSGPVEQYLPRNWNDTYGGRLGVSWWATRDVELLFGGGVETAASPDSTLAPDIPDATNVQGALGIRYMATESLFLTASYTHIQYLNRNNVGKSTLAVEPNGTQVAVPTAEEDAGGEYKAWVGAFTGNVEALF